MALSNVINNIVVKQCLILIAIYDSKQFFFKKLGSFKIHTVSVEQYSYK